MKAIMSGMSEPLFLFLSFSVGSLGSTQDSVSHCT